MIKKKYYIILFIILYVCTAAVSTFHAVSFFHLANNWFMASVLAGTFEIGQAAVLFSLLNSNKERSKFMPWALMSILTLVQVMGNVFSSYKYLMTNSSEELQYFTEPILFFMGDDTQMTNIILTYVIGAILPIVALCMTSIVSNYLEDENLKDVKKTEIIENLDITNLSTDENQEIDIKQKLPTETEKTEDKLEKVIIQ